MIKLYFLSMFFFTIIMTTADILTNKHYKNIKNKIKIKKLIVMLITHNIYYFTQYFTILFILLFGFRNIQPIIILFYLFYCI